MSLEKFHDLLAVKYTEWIESMDSIPEEDDPQIMEVTIGMAPDLPPIKYHESPLQFLSKPLISMREWERRCIDGRNFADAAHDEVTIRCPNGEKTDPKIFRVPRSTLSRAPALITFFKSEFYATNCDMLLSFMNDPAAVLDIVIRYLDQGPELFDTATLRVYIYRHYTTLARIVVMVRLCKVANNLGLWYLHEMAFGILEDGSRDITARMLPAVANLVFAVKANQHTCVKEWCLGHIGHHFLELKGDENWSRCLTVSEEELSVEWNKMMQQNADIIYSLENDSDEKVLERKFHRLSHIEQDRVISLIGDRAVQEEEIDDSLFLSNLRFGDQVPNGANHVDQREGLDTPSTPVQQIRPDPDDKLMMGTGTERPPLSRSASAEVAKARQVMGIDSPRAPLSERRLKRRKGRMLSGLLSPRLIKDEALELKQLALSPLEKRVNGFSPVSRSTNGSGRSSGDTAQLPLM